MSRATEKAAFDRAVEKHYRVISFIFNAAIGAVKLAELDQQDLPTFCVSAACRPLELLIEKQHRAISGEEALTEAEQTTLRRTIIASAIDLRRVLEEGLASVSTLTAYSDKLVPAPEKETERPVES